MTEKFECPCGQIHDVHPNARRSSATTDNTERARLIEAAVQGVAWALIEDDTDTSDRGVSEEHYAERVADARRMLPALIEREPAVVDDATERVIAYVSQVIRDRKYSHDAEWMRLNLHPEHLRRLAALTPDAQKEKR